MRRSQPESKSKMMFHPYEHDQCTYKHKHRKRQRRRVPNSDSSSSNVDASGSYSGTKHILSFLVCLLSATTTTRAQTTTPTVQVPFTTCRIGMAVSDVDRNGLLSQTEFVTLLNRLFGNVYVGTAFEVLPTSLQATFNELAAASGTPATQITIAGSSPADFASATEVQRAFLERICNDVQASYNLATSGGAGGVGTGTLPPAVATSPPVTATIPPAVSTVVPATTTPPVVVSTTTLAPATPALPFAQCRVTLAIADTNRDQQLSQEEYVVFINRLTRNAYAGFQFVQLPAVLQSNYQTLAPLQAPPTTLSVAGALPADYNTATPELQAYLQRVCDETQGITSGTATVTTTPPVVATIPPIISTSPPVIATAPPVIATAPPIVATTPPVVTTTPPVTNPPGVTLVPFSTCRARMFVADANRDQFLSPEEYAVFVDRLIETTSYPNYASLTPILQANYEELAAPSGQGQILISGASPAQPVDATQLAFLETVCTNTQVAAATPPVVATLAPTLPIPIVTPPPAPVVQPPTYAPLALISCTDMMRISDENRNERLDQAEYVTFVYQLSSNQLFVNENYNNLPENLKSNFRTLSDDGGLSLNVQGGTVGANGVDEVQAQQAFQICQATQTALNDYVISTATPPPTPPPKVMTPIPQCKTTLVGADTDNNLQLLEIEYTSFANAIAATSYGLSLGPGGIPATTFASLPQNLQTNFRTLATPSGGVFISLAGAPPFPPATPQQDAALRAICTLTDNEIYEALYGSAAVTQAPAVMPTPPPTPRPTHSPQDCLQDLITVDLNSDSYLAPNEYVAFLNRFSENAFAGVLFDNLHPVLNESFWELAAVDFTSSGREYRADSIDIFGVNPPDLVRANEAQLQHLTRVCQQTTYAIQDALRPPTLAPTLGPTITRSPTVAPEPTMAPTIFDGIVTCFTTFIIYNRDGITAETLSNPAQQDRRDLQLAYSAMVINAVGNNPYPSTPPPLVMPPFPAATGAPLAVGAAPPAAAEAGRHSSSFLRGRRRWLVALETGTATILSIESRECPQDLALDPFPELCQTVYASYTLSQVVGSEKDAVKNYYTDLTQQIIAQGGLEAALEAISPNPRFEIYGITDVVEWTFPPTSAPTRPPTNNGDDGGGVNRTVLFVCLVGIMSLIALGVYFGWNDKDKIREKWREFKNRKKRKDKQQHGEENQDEMLEGLEGQEDQIQYEIGDDGEIIYPEGFEEEYELEEYEEEVIDEEHGGKTKKKKVRPKKLLGKLGKGVKQVGIHGVTKVFLNEHDIDVEEMEAIGFRDEPDADFEDYVFDTPAELLEQNAAKKNNLDEGAANETNRDEVKASGIMGVAHSVVAGINPVSMTDSTASSASDMGDSEMDDDNFDDEYDSLDDNSTEEGEDDNEYNLEFSDSGGGEADSISTKEDKDLLDQPKDEDSLSSTEDQKALMTGEGDIEGMLANARLNTDKEPGSGSYSGSDGDDSISHGSGSNSNSSYSSDTTTSSAEQRLEEYRKEVKELVEKVIPGELDNLSTMMDQFEGREAELINTLQNMEERTSTQRARAAVHKTKVKVNPNQVGGYSIASEGSAVIAAASTLGPEPQRRQPRRVYDEETYYSDEDGTNVIKMLLFCEYCHAMITFVRSN